MLFACALPGTDLAEQDALVRVPHQQRQRPAAHRLGQHLRAQVGCANRIRLIDDARAAILVAADGQRQPEGKDQADDAEQRTLQHGERFSHVRVLTMAPAKQHGDPSRAEHDGGQNQSQLDAVEAKQHGATLADAGARCTAHYRNGQSALSRSKSRTYLGEFFEFRTELQQIL